jgi:ATP:ADP antiporter, AAA family
MNLRSLRLSPVTVVAMVASAMVTAQFIAGKATRDALFFANYDVTVLPTMVITTAVVSILFAIGSSKAFSRMSPSVFVPLAFAVSAVLLIVEWALLPIIPKTAASIVYLQISGIGPMLGSGFWLIVSERFDPRTAKQQFGPIAGAGTLGGLVGGLMSERVAAQLDMASMLPILAVLGLGCAWAVRQLATTNRRAGRPLPVDIAPDLSKAMPRPGLRMLRDTPYLRNLAFLVLLGTTGAALIDYVFKASAVSRLGPGEPLLRFFAIYYAAISLLTFLMQVTFSRTVLQRFGLGVSAATPAIALFTGGLGALVFPGLSSAIAARGGESVFRGSLFRASYEIFYTPIPRREKRAAKSLVDVAFDRLGDAVGGGLLRLSLLLAPDSRITTILMLSIGTAVTAIFVATRLNRGYILTLERSLLNRAAELDLDELDDPMTQTMMLQTSSIRLPPIRRVTGTGGATAAGTRSQTRSETDGSPDLDHDLSLIRALRSRNREVITEALHSSDALPSTTIQDVIPLLAWDAVAEDVGIALRRIAEDHVGQLIDTLLDQNQDFAVRRRLARVFTVCVSQRAVDGLMLGLEDRRFEVRFQCARSLVSIIEKNPRVHVNRDVIFEMVRRETTVGRPVWESHRLLNLLEDRDEHVFVDEFVKERANRSLAHVFTLLSLALPPEPLRIAFRGLHTNDPTLQGTALEYLEGVLPLSIREKLWPYLEDRRPSSGRPSRPRDEILADLVRSHDSIMINLEELEKREQGAKSKP